jgi:hypothetical protein
MELLLSYILHAILLFFAGLWLKNYLPSYFDEKGKLLAQKEDIEKITEKIESVKYTFTRETELLKAEVQRLLSIEVSHRNEERNSIIAFYDKYNQWLYALLEINYGAYNRGNVKDLIDKRIYIERFYADASVAQAKLKLLVKDKEIIDCSHKLMGAILEFKGWIDKRLLSLQHNFEKHNTLTDQFLLVIKKLEENKVLAYKLAKEEKEIKKEYKDLIDEFYANRNNEAKKIYPIDTEFTIIVKSYLTK